MDILNNILQGALAFIQTPVGLGVVICAIVAIIRALILWTPTTVDDAFLAKYGKAVYSAAALAEKAIPDGTQIVALAFIDSALKAIGEGSEVDITNDKLMTVVKKQLIKVAKASTKVNTTPEELLKLKN